MNKLIIDNNGYKNLVSKICHDITVSNWRPDYVVGITRGGLLPAIMISQYFDIPCETLKVSLRDSESGPESNLWMAEHALGYVPEEIRAENGGFHHLEQYKKNILIVDDINDTGATLNWILNDWPSGCFPDVPEWNKVWNNNVRFATVVDNLASHCNVSIDYVGMEVNKAEKDVWVEFPYEEWWTK